MSSTFVSTIQNLISLNSLGLMTAHQWYADAPANTDPTFGSGHFSGGDLPFGLVYELHNAPADFAYDWPNSLVYKQPLAHVVNNAKIVGGYSSTIPAEEFFINRPRGVLRFGEPSTDSIYIDVIGGAYLELWGLFINIPLYSITQMTWAPGAPGLPVFPTTRDGTSFPGTSGHGSFALDVGSVGVRVDITTLPGRVGEAGLEPITLWDCGYLAWCDGSACAPAERIRHTSYVSFPPVAQAYDHIQYDVPADVTVTFTCLLRNF